LLCSDCQDLWVWGNDLTVRLRSEVPSGRVDADGLVLIVINDVRGSDLCEASKPTPYE